MTHRALAAGLALLLSACGGTALSSDGEIPVDAAMVVATDGRVPLDAAASTSDLVSSPDLTARDFSDRADLTASPDLAPESCGGFAGRPCGAGEFCQSNAGQCCCDIPGVCVPLPQVCGKNFDPVCGCDGKTYTNDCLRQAAGVTQDHKGACNYKCGTGSCTPDETCFQSCCGAAGCTPPPPSCQPAPAACNGTATCACIPMMFTQSCKDLPGGGVLITQMFCP